MGLPRARACAVPCLALPRGLPVSSPFPSPRPLAPRLSPRPSLLPSHFPSPSPYLKPSPLNPRHPGLPPSPLRARPSLLTRRSGGGLASHGAPAVRSAARAPPRVRPGTGSRQRLQLGPVEGWVLGVPVRALMRMYGLYGSMRGQRSAAPVARGARRPARAQGKARAHVGRHPHAHARSQTHRCTHA